MTTPILMYCSIGETVPHLGVGGWRDPLWVGLRPAWPREEFLSATNSGFATVESARHWAIAMAMLRVGMAE